MVNKDEWNKWPSTPHRRHKTHTFVHIDLWPRHLQNFINSSPDYISDCLSLGSNPLISSRWFYCIVLLYFDCITVRFVLLHYATCILIGLGYWTIFSNLAVQLFSCNVTIKLSWVELSNSQDVNGVVAWPRTLIHDLENLFSSAHSHDGILWQVSLKAAHQTKKYDITQNKCQLTDNGRTIQPSIEYAAEAHKTALCCIVYCTIMPSYYRASRLQIRFSPVTKRSLY